MLREQNAALGKAEQAKKQLQVAESKIEDLKNPFAPRNVLQWLLDHGPRILAILFGMVLMQWSSRLLTRRFVHLLSRSGMRGHPGRARGPRQDARRRLPQRRLGGDRHRRAS